MNPWEEYKKKKASGNSSEGKGEGESSSPWERYKRDNQVTEISFPEAKPITTPMLRTDSLQMQEQKLGLPKRVQWSGNGFVQEPAVSSVNIVDGGAALRQMQKSQREDPHIQAAFSAREEKQNYLKETLPAADATSFAEVLDPVVRTVSAANQKENPFAVPVQNMAGLILGYNDSYTTARGLVNEMEQFRHGEAMTPEEITDYGDRVDQLIRDAQYSLSWLEANRNRITKEEYDSYQQYYTWQLQAAGSLKNTVNWYRDGNSAEVLASHEDLRDSFYSGTAPVDEINQEIADLEGQIALYDEKIDEMSRYLAGTNLDDATRGRWQQAIDALVEKRQEVAAQLAVAENKDQYLWAMAFASMEADGDAEAKIAAGKAATEAADHEKEQMALLAASFGGGDSAVNYECIYEQYPLAIDKDHLTDEELRTFWYLAGAGYVDMAVLYAQSMAVDRRREKLAAVEAWAGTNFGTQLLALVQQSTLFPVAGYDVITGMAEAEHSGLPVSPNLGPSAIKDSLNSGVASAWNEFSGVIPEQVPVLGGQGLGAVYQLGVSIGESYGSAAAFGYAAPVFMALSAGSSGYNDAIMSGASPEEALLKGAAQGLAEALFEKISIGRWLDGKDYGSIIKNALVQGGVEASEETLTSITNHVTDRLILAEKSAYEQSVRAYMEEGLSREEAENKASWDFWESVAFDALSGFASGGIMGAGKSAAQHMGSNTPTMYGQSFTASAQNVSATEMPDQESTAVNDDPAEHTPEEMQVIEEYKKSTDISLRNLFSSVFDGTKQAFSRHKISDVSERQASDASRLLGGDYSGYSNSINTNGVRHILNDHGPNGAVDKSLEDLDDAARIGYVLDHYDNVEVVTYKSGDYDLSAEFRNANNEPAPMLRYSKKVNGTYYVVEAIPESRHKKFWVVSAYMQKKTDDLTEAPNAHSLRNTPEASLPSQSSVTNILSQTSETVNEESSSAERKTVEAVFEMLLDFGVQKGAAQSLAEQYDPAEGVKPETYARGAAEAWHYGRAKFSEAEMLDKKGFSVDLSEKQRSFAYRIGQVFQRKQTAAREAEIRNMKKTAREDGKNATRGSVEFHKDIDRESLSQRQKVSVEALEKLAKALGAKIRLFQSEIRDGKPVGENGWYDPKTGEIHIDIQAGENGEGTILFTAAHELTHFIYQWSPAKFKILADFLVEQYGKKGQSVADLVRAQQEKAKRNGRKLGWSEAYQEMVADSMETMLSDGKVIEKLMELRARDKSLVQKIRAWFKAFAEKLRAVYRNMSPDTQEGKLVAEMVGVTERLQELFTEALAEAGENYRAIGAQKNTAEEGGSVRYSFRNSTTGMANDGLRPYNAELRKIIEGQGNVIIDSYTKLQELVNRVFDNPGVKGNAYFGILDYSTLANIEKNIPNMPLVLNGELFKKNKDYSIAATFDSIRHMVDEKSLSRDDVLDYLDRLADTISDFDTVAFDYYTDSMGKKNNGILFKKQFPDGVLQSFNIVSNKKKSISLITVYLESGAYQKKKSAKTLPMQNAPAHTLKAGVGQTSTDSIAQQTENDNTKNKIFSDRGNVTSRDVLDQLDPAQISNEIRRKHVQEYQNVSRKLDQEQKNAAAAREELRQLRSGKGKRDMPRIRALEEELRKANNRIDIQAGKLLRMEQGSILQRVLQQEQQKTIDRIRREDKKAFEAYRAESRQSHAREVEELRRKHREQKARSGEIRKKAELREKIKKQMQNLQTLFTNGPKKNNVKADIREAAASMLASAEMIFSKSNNYSYEEMVRNGIGTQLTEEEARKVNRYVDLLARLDELESHMELYAASKEEGHMRYVEDVEKRIAKTKSEIGALNRELSEVFVRERRRINDIMISPLIGEIAEGYAKLKNSEYGYVQAAYDEAVYQRLLVLKESVGATIARDMSVGQLQEFSDAITMVTTTVQNANTLFVDGKREDLKQCAETVISQIREKVPKTRDNRLAFMEKVRGFAWENLKPVYAMRAIGSKQLEELYWECVRAEGVYAADITEAGDFVSQIRKKYGYSKWDKSKTHSFDMGDGRMFTLNVEQIMSIFAYSRRDQAIPHMLAGGFVFDRSETFRKGKFGAKRLPSQSETYRVDGDLLEQIFEKLEPDQRMYATEMQDYLTKMGEKGNAVSRTLYGIDIFNEKHYFPLKSAQEFLSASDVTLQQTETTSSLKNSGMTKEIVPRANNPIVLTNFDDVWMNHVNKMATYHAFVVPIDNLNKVFNYTDRSGEKNLSFRMILNGAYGTAATDYLERYIQDLNGGVASSGYQGLTMSMFGKFKGAAVGASLSTAIQQPTAILRAMAYVRPDYFLPVIHGRSSKTVKVTQLYEEMKKYAPIAVIKEMGGFDVGSNTQAKDYIGITEYEGMDKLRGFFRDSEYRKAAVNNASGFLAQKGDELGWTVIWSAVKREVAAKQKQFTPGSEAYLQACGKRFTEVIALTQVYDSVNSRSGLMRSKGDLNKFATSFAGEPTTSLNMLVDAVLQFRRGGKMQAAKSVAAVLASTIAAAAAASVVYAMRDDDDDKPWGEKWAEQFGSKLAAEFGFIQVGDIPIPTAIGSMIPYVRDLISILNGSDVERPDMSLVSDLVTAFKKLSRDDVTTYRKIEEFAGSIAALFGVPLRNVMKDCRGLFNAYSAATGDLESGNLWEAFKRGFTGKTESAAEQLYTAMVDDDSARVAALKENYADDYAFTNAVRGALRENDSRIEDAAIAHANGDVAEYIRIVEEILAEGHFDEQDILAAIRAEEYGLDQEDTGSSEHKHVKRFDAADYLNAILSGDRKTAAAVKDDLINEYLNSGKDAQEAQKAFVSGVRSDIGDRFKTGELDYDTAMDYLVRYGELSEEDAYWKLDAWSYVMSHGSDEGYSKQYSTIAQLAGNAVADQISASITALSPEEGYIGVRPVQKWEAIVSADGLTGQQQREVLKTYMTDSQVEALEICMDAGVSAADFVAIYRAKETVGDQNGSWTQDELRAYLDNSKFTRAQKAAIWEAFGKNWKTNPYQ